MINLLKFLNPVVAVVVYYIYIVIHFTVVFFTSNIYGFFIFTWVIYYFLPIFGILEPLSPYELIQIISQLDVNYKTAIISSTITIAGFVIAFNAATKNWKQQMVATLYLNAGDELDELFSKILSALCDADIYIRTLIKAKKTISESKNINEIKFCIDSIQLDHKRFVLNRDELSNLTQRAILIANKHNVLMSAPAGIGGNIKKSVQLLRKFGDLIWIYIPIIEVKSDEDYQYYADVFLSKVDFDSCQKFVDEYKKSNTKISMSIGGVRGKLISPLLGLNFSAVMNLFSMRNDFLNTFKKISKSEKKENEG